MLVINTIIPSTLGWDLYFPLKEQNILEALGLGFTVILQIISCVFLTIAMRTIGRVVKDKVGVQINLRTLILHLSSYYLYLVSFIAFYVEEMFYIFAPPSNL